MSHRPRLSITQLRTPRSWSVIRLLDLYRDGSRVERTIRFERRHILWPIEEAEEMCKEPTRLMLRSIFRNLFRPILKVSNWLFLD